MTGDPDPLKERAKALWSLGNYSLLAERLRPAAAELVAACEIAPGDRVLDVAAGNGNAALEAAARGARVVASDLTPAMVALGRERTAAAGAEVRWREADAEALPFGDGEFDAVVSVFGAMLAPRPERAAGELARVTRPGGRVGLTAWLPEGVMGRLADIGRRYLPPPPELPAPQLWGDPAVARARLEPFFDELVLPERVLRWEFPSVEEATGFFEENAAPVVMARRELGEPGFAPMRAEIRDLLGAWSTPAPGGIAFEAGWLLIGGRRRSLT